MLARTDLAAPSQPWHDRHARELTILVLAATIALVVAVRLQFLSIPFERDEGAYFYFGRLLLDGETPYVGFYEQKFPGLFYTYAIITALFGYGVESAHAGFLVVNVLTILLVYLTARTLLDAFAGVVGAATFAILSLGPQVAGFTTQSEHLVAFFATGGTLLLLLADGQPRRRWLLFGSGTLYGAAFLVKPNGVFFIAFGAAAILLHWLMQRPRPWRTLCLDGSAFLAGVVALCIVSVLQVVARGALRDMWYWAWVFPQRYVTDIPFRVGMQWFWETAVLVARSYVFFWITSLAGLALVWFSPISTYKRLFIVLLGVSSFLTIVPGLRFFGHYWIQLLPAASIASAAAFHATRHMLGARVGRSTAGLVLTGAFVGALAINVWAQRAYYIRPDHTRILRDVYFMNPFPEAMVVGEFLRAHTTAQDQIVVLGSEPQINVYADRRSPTRHTALTYLMTDVKAFPYNTALQQELIRDVTQARPKYMVFVRSDASWMVSPNADRSILRWFDGFAAEHYRLVGLIDTLTPDDTRYRWYDEIDGYTPKGRTRLSVYERRG